MYILSSVEQPNHGINSSLCTPSSLSVPHIFSDGATARWGAAGKDQEEETLWRGRGQSAVTEPGLSCQLHARGRSRAQRPQTRGGLSFDDLIHSWSLLKKTNIQDDSDAIAPSNM